ncbi:MAG: peptidylprolyl isomerase [Planctomycetota bacterium]
MIEGWNKAVFSLCVLGGLCCGALAGDVQLAGLEDVPLVAGEVNGVLITRYDLVRELVGAAATEALDRLARRALVEQEARKLQVVATAEDIERQLAIDTRDLNEELIRDFPDLNKEFPMADLIYARFRMTVEEYKNLVVRQRLLTRRCLAKGLAPTEDELRRAFEDNPELFQPRALYHACHILISPLDPRDMYRGFRFRNPVAQMMKIDAERRKNIDLYREHGIDLEGKGFEGDPAWAKFRQDHPDLQLGAPPVDQIGPAWSKSEQIARKVLADIRAGLISWENAVRKYSQDPLDHVRAWPDGRKESERDRARRPLPPLPPGDVGTFHSRGPLVKEFYEGVKDLRPGEIGGPVKTEFGYHLVKMLEVQKPPPVTFAQCREKVEELYIERATLRRAEKWISGLLEQANLKMERSPLWPPEPGAPATPAPADPDPVAGAVNGVPLRRSEIWRELLRSDGDEALARLIHFEIVMTMLKDLGVERLEWESSNPARRDPRAPPPQPIRINPEAVEMELNNDRLRRDAEAPDMSLPDYIRLCYGQSVEEYKRKLEAGLILREAIGRRVSADEGTLRVQFALARDHYSEPPSYDLSHILIKPTGGMDNSDDNTRLQAKLLADQIRKMCVAKPDSFATLVQDYSMDTAENKEHGGALGTCYPEVRNASFPEGPQLYAEISKENLQRGQFSAPIATRRGWHIVRVDAVHPERRAEFEQVKERVARDYLQEQARICTDMWLRLLTAQAKVKRYLFQRNAPIIEELPPDNFQPPKDK